MAGRAREKDRGRGACWALALFALAGACRQEPALGAAEAAAIARGEVDQRLQGSWKLVSFTPDEALTPVLQALLAFQFERLTVEFAQGRMYAHSPGVEVDRTYRIEQPAGDTFQLVVLDELNIDYVSTCELGDDGRLRFESRTSPWRGRGVLARP